MKSYMATERKYYQEKIYFDIDSLKSLFIEKDFKKLEIIEALIKNRNNRKEFEK